MWQGLAGHWEGTWTDHTFSSDGTLTADVTVNAECTAEATIEGIFMQPGPIFGDTTEEGPPTGAALEFLARAD